MEMKSIISLLMDRLSPRDLLNMAQCDKYCKETLQYEHVFKSVISHNKERPTRNLKNVMKLLQLQCIHLPSPVRLLQLCLGKACEGCGERGRHTPIVIGLSLCMTCLSNKAYTFVPSRESSLEDELSLTRALSHHQVCRTRFGKSHRVNFPLHTFVNLEGEKCGPYVTAKTIMQLKRNSTMEQFEKSLRNYINNLPKPPIALIATFESLVARNVLKTKRIKLILELKSHKRQKV